jgi:hypothetical protein
MLIIGIAGGTGSSGEAYGYKAAVYVNSGHTMTTSYGLSVNIDHDPLAVVSDQTGVALGLSGDISGNRFGVNFITISRISTQIFIVISPFC